MTAPQSADDRSIAAMANQLAEMQRQIDLLKMGQNTSTLGFSSIEDGSLVIYDANGDPRTVIGKQDDGSYVGGVSPTASSPPEVPEPPTVVAGFGTLKVATHGSSDPPWPHDFSHINVYLAKGVPGGDDPLEGGSVVATIIGMNDSMTVISGLEPTPYRVWLTSVNISTSESGPSPAVTATPTMVVGQDILDGAIGELQLADDAVTAAKLAAGSVGTIQIQGESIDVTKLADGSVGADQIIASAIAAGHIAAGAITSVALAANAVQALNIAAGAIQAGKIAAGAITAEAILALAITADKIAANAITTGKIAAGAITADKIQAGIVIADASLETGVSGRRVVISGPANEIRFMPQLKETAYGRLFSYVSLEYPDDVNIEMRAIDSDQVNVQPRMFMTPDSIFLGITDAANEAVNRGGRVDLQEGAAAFGLETATGQQYGLYVYDDGLMEMRGRWDYYMQPHANDAIYTQNILVKNTASTYITGTIFSYSQTMETPMAPVVSCGFAVYTDSIVHAVRDVNNTLTGYNIEWDGGGSPSDGAAATSSTGWALQPNKTIKLRSWVFRTAIEFDAT